MLGAAIAQSLPVAVGLALAAAPMVVLAVVLVSKRPPGVSYAFLGGWVLGLLVAGGVILAAFDLLTPGATTLWWVDATKVVLGVVLVAMGVRKWVARPREADEPQVPGWMAAADMLGARRAFTLGLLLAGANPKNLVLVVAGVAAIVDVTSQVTQQLVALACFAVVASVGVAAPTAVRLVLGSRSGRVLSAADAWLTRHSASIMAGVMLVLGLVLVANGISGS